MKRIKFFLVSLFLSFSLFALGQDTLRTKNDTIVCKVIEIGLDEIKYKDFQNLEGPVIVIEKNKVVEITYENGSKYFLKPDPYEVSKEVEVRGKTHAIKFELFSPATNDVAFGYESMISVGKNIEFKVGLIGIGVNEDGNNPSGVFFKAGLKFLTSPQYLQNGLRYVHPLKGRYIKPELILNTYSEDRIFYSNNQGYYTSYSKRVQVTNLAVNVIFGTQHILGNAMTIDYYIGIGYGLRIDESKEDLYYEYTDGSYEYSHSYLGDNFPLIISGGFTIGGIF